MREPKVFLIGDCHFGHKNIIRYCNRPFKDVDDMTEKLIKLWNNVVGNNDIVYVVGDFALCGKQKIIEIGQRLNGRKRLIMGNHDLGRTNYERQIVEEIYDQDEWSRDEVIVDMTKKYPGWHIWVTEQWEFHAPFQRWVAHADNRLFDEVYEGALIIGEKVILTHEPVEIPWLWNFHGHDHAGAFRSNHTNVCSDACGYEPMQMNEFFKKFGISSKITSIHRMTIDGAIERKAKRGGKKIGEKKKREEHINA